jgi:hypothetical protein
VSGCVSGAMMRLFSIKEGFYKYDLVNKLFTYIVVFAIDAVQE